MKTTFLYSACAAALLASSPALAGTPVLVPSGGNTSTVTQAGSFETADVTQTGAHDDSTISQIGATSSGNGATVTQTGASGGKSIITQSGTSNQASVTTADDGSIYDVNAPPPPGVNATLPITLSIITQSGASNQATVDQKSQFNADQSKSEVVQSGLLNEAIVTQRDDSQTSSVMQTSEQNYAEVTQGVDDPAGDATWGNASIVNQMGVGNNQAVVRQIGKIDDSTVTQSGSGGRVTVNQKDATLFAGSTTSAASRNSSTVTQSAFAN